MLNLYKSKYKSYQIKSWLDNKLTGGDTGSSLEGLRDIYYNPDVYGVLPYKHNYTQTGETVMTAYFIPSFTVVNTSECMDSRGYTDPEKGKAYYDAQRAKKSSSPKALITYAAEYCYNAEEAFSLEGDNKFNKVNIAELLANIRLHKRGPKIETGILDYTFKDNRHVREDVTGFIWKLMQSGKVKIIEHPIWTDYYRENLRRLNEKRELQGEETEPIPVVEEMGGLYVIGIDGIDIGASLTSEYTKDPSDFCLVVKKRVYGLQEPQYVAIYKDRPNDIKEAYKTAIKLALYYNAIINIEATRMSFVTWARDHKYLNYFMKRPRATLPDVNKGVSKLYGTPATGVIIAHQTDLIADYVNDYCYTIWFDEILDELNRYSDDLKRKFDIVAAMGMAELADEELSGVVPKTIKNTPEVWQDVGYYTDADGVKHWGVIPRKKQTIGTNNEFNQFDDYSRNRTSDPRSRSGYLSDEVYR